MIEAFSPGSVTLFFEIKDDKKDPLKIGSRGVGICLSRGVRTKIQRSSKIEAVSYTHLTLPTICSV